MSCHHGMLLALVPFCEAETKSQLLHVSWESRRANGETWKFAVDFAHFYWCRKSRILQKDSSRASFQRCKAHRHEDGLIFLAQRTLPSVCDVFWIGARLTNPFLWHLPTIAINWDLCSIFRIDHRWHYTSHNLWKQKSTTQKQHEHERFTIKTLRAEGLQAGQCQSYQNHVHGGNFLHQRRFPGLVGIALLCVARSRLCIISRQEAFVDIHSTWWACVVQHFVVCFPRWRFCVGY